jgi:hypothetical protein
MTVLRRLHDEDKGKVRTTKIRKISLRRRGLVVSSRDVGVAVMAPRRDDGKKMAVAGAAPAGPAPGPWLLVLPASDNERTIWGP